jgi:hypothetical protein
VREDVPGREESRVEDGRRGEAALRCFMAVAAA